MSTAMSLTNERAKLEEQLDQLKLDKLKAKILHITSETALIQTQTTSLGTQIRNCQEETNAEHIASTTRVVEIQALSDAKTTTHTREMALEDLESKELDRKIKEKERLEEERLAEEERVYDQLFSVLRTHFDFMVKTHTDLTWEEFSKWSFEIIDFQNIRYMLADRCTDLNCIMRRNIAEPYGRKRQQTHAQKKELKQQLSPFPLCDECSSVTGMMERMHGYLTRIYGPHDKRVIIFVAKDVLVHREAIRFCAKHNCPLVLFTPDAYSIKPCMHLDYKDRDDHAVILMLLALLQNGVHAAINSNDQFRERKHWKSACNKYTMQLYINGRNVKNVAIDPKIMTSHECKELIYSNRGVTTKGFPIDPCQQTQSAESVQFTPQFWPTSVLAQPVQFTPQFWPAPVLAQPYFWPTPPVLVMFAQQYHNPY